MASRDRREGAANAGIRIETRFSASDGTPGLPQTTEGLVPVRVRVSRSLPAGGWERGRLRAQGGPFHSQDRHLLVRVPSSSSEPGLRHRRIPAPPRAKGTTQSHHVVATARPRSLWPWPQAPGFTPRAAGRGALTSRELPSKAAGRPRLSAARSGPGPTAGALCPRPRPPPASRPAGSQRPRNLRKPPNGKFAEFAPAAANWGLECRR